jgi:hypothetical protein
MESNESNESNEKLIKLPPIIYCVVPVKHITFLDMVISTENEPFLLIGTNSGQVMLQYNHEPLNPWMKKTNKSICYSPVHINPVIKIVFSSLERIASLSDKHLKAYDATHCIREMTTKDTFTDLIEFQNHLICSTQSGSLLLLKQDLKGVSLTSSSSKTPITKLLKDGTETFIAISPNSYCIYKGLALNLIKTMQLDYQIEHVLSMSLVLQVFCTNKKLYFQNKRISGLKYSIEFKHNIRDAILCNNWAILCFSNRIELFNTLTKETSYTMDIPDKCCAHALKIINGNIYALMSCD